jgi:Protein of unknown function (DUF2924)
MPRRQIQPSWEATPSHGCAAAEAAPTAAGVMPKEPAATLARVSLNAGPENTRLRSSTATSLGAAAPIPARRARAPSREPSYATSALVEADVQTRKAPEAPRREPLDGDLIRRRWRSLIGRHPPKTLSHVLLDRILVWREQVAEVGDISSRSHAILAAALAGKAGGGKDGHAPNSEGAGNDDAHRHRTHAPIRVGTTLIREHAGVLHRVTVVAEGFEWDGHIFASLSALARAITGVRWNGRRFFGLDRGATQVVARNASKRTAGARLASRDSSRVGARTQRRRHSPQIKR